MALSEVDVLSPYAVPLAGAPEFVECARSLAPWPKPDARGDAVPSARMEAWLREVLAGWLPGSTRRNTAETKTDLLLHDAYFHVRRVEGDNARIFLRSLWRAHLTLIEEVRESQVNVDEAHLSQIDRALSAIACFALGRSQTELPARIWSIRGTGRDPLRRWVRGHQIFAALTQGLSFVFEAFARVGADDRAAFEAHSELATRVIEGCGASLLLTGDLSVDDYNDSIRPSMSPPAVPEPLSGLMSSDHRYLVQQMRTLQHTFARLYASSPVHYEQLSSAFAQMYDHHRFVCARFVGDQPSILTDGITEKSGAELLGQFKQLRMKVFPLAKDQAASAHDAAADRSTSIPSD